MYIMVQVHVYIKEFLTSYNCANEFFHHIISYFFLLRIGTRLFYPPEWLTKSTYYAVPGTVWAVGVMLYRMLQGSLPFDTNKQIIAASVSFKKPISTGNGEHALE